MNYAEASMKLHREKRGKMELAPTVSLETRDDLSIAYTPGVAAPCEAIAKDKSLAYDLTIKGRFVAVVTDGSAVLGLGNIGPEAAMPVMEGKAILYKKFAGIDAFPICLATQDTEAIIATVKNIAPGFGAIHLEDISAPRCFEIEDRLSRELDVPVMHDDQHGTAVVVLAGILNALEVVGKSLESASVVISGVGAAGIATANLLLEAGATHIAMVDSKGIIAVGRDGMNDTKTKMAARINAEGRTGSLAEAMVGADVFVGVSAPGIVTEEMVRAMAPGAIVFAMANPTPEIMPDLAKAAGAAVVATGRSDYSNQVNNVLAYPGMFLGVLEARTPRFTNAMRIASARALAAMVEEPTAEHILPSLLEGGAARIVADAVKAVV
ncbi:malate dehydrogenase [Candidatus Uhrbacteria bacterium RIFOXYB2_FULL_57_15]|uniref:Malate dehydrogenase n=1 Tax=Candidatus Uhrbacteria bacterium RIFOXYB2_FULL_57_15 TaxID=1802422 RepID=A0A1F7W683_9BACT|nr:MAG: malate dehydrogenase [Candidatus Uhrbacteria bacterium RIFOXYB2_FULL_57_15]